MEIPLTRFFRKDKQAAILKRFQEDLQVYQSGVPCLSTFTSFRGPEMIARYAYVCGAYPLAISLFRAACEAGRPLIVEPADPSPWMRVSQVRVLIDLGKAAFVCGLRDLSRNAFLRAHELVPHEDELVKCKGDASIYRHYSALALGQEVKTLPLKGSGYDWETWMIPLSRTISALIQFRLGQIDRAGATQALYQLISKTNGEDNQRVDAIAHALYLQSAFPDAFDPVLPPLHPWSS